MMIYHGLQQKKTILTEQPPEDVQNSPYTKVDDPLKKLTSTTDCSTEIMLYPGLSHILGIQQT